MKWTLWKRLLVAFVAFGVTPMALVIYILDREAAASLQSAAVESLLAVANQKVAHIEQYMGERKGDVRIVSQLPSLVDSLKPQAHQGPHYGGTRERATRLLQMYVQVYDYRDAILVRDDGEILIRLGVDNRVAGGADASRKARAELTEAARTLAQTAVIDYFDTTRQRRMAWIGRPVIANGRISGFVLLQIDFERLFTAITSETGSGRTEETLLVSTTGSDVEFVAWRGLEGGPPPRLRMGDPRGVPEQRAASGAKGSGFAVDYRGVPVVAVYRHIPSLGWGLVVKVDRAEALAPVSRFRVAAGTIAVAALLLLVLIGWFIAWSITRPLAQLQVAVERVADGHFDQRVETTPADDEIGRLSSAFNEMTVKLQQWSELTAAKHRLEGELRERAEVEQLRAELARSEQLAGLGRVATAMAHEFNNVLMSIQSLNDATLRIRTFEQFARTLPIIDRAVQRGKRITGEVRNLGRAARATLLPVEVSAWLEELAAELRSLLDARVDLTVASEGDPGYMLADSEQLKQVLVNLALNARDAMDSSGKLSVRAVRRFGPDGSQIELAVSDSGRGIEPAVLDRIFEPLFTTRRDGAGLGLAVAHAIVNAHGGQITVESVPGVGTTFTLTLRGAPPPDIEQQDPKVPLTGAAARRVLLVEDDEIVASGVSLLLELEGFEVRHVATARAAMETLRTFTPDVLLLDIRLGADDGIALYREIEELLPLPVVFASGHGDVGQLGHYATRANVAFLAKPFAAEELVAALELVTSSDPGRTAVV